jgi:competence protein ComEA
MKTCSLRRYKQWVGRSLVTGFVALAVLVSVHAQEKQPEPAKDQPKAQLPDNPGKDTFLKVCGTCHSTDNVIGKGYSEDGWAQVVSTMVNNGAQMSDEQMDTIVKYLATSFPPIVPKVNVNTASAEILEKRLAITAKEAQAIVDYRQHSGDFKSVDDLKHVPDLDSSKIDAKKNLIIF